MRYCVIKRYLALSVYYGNAGNSSAGGREILTLPHALPEVLCIGGYRIEVTHEKDALGVVQWGLKHMENGFLQFLQVTHGLGYV